MSSWIDYAACWFVKTAGRLICRLPPETACWLGRRCGLPMRLLTRERALIAYANLRAALSDTYAPQELWGMVRRLYSNIGQGVVELLRIPRMDASYAGRYIEVQGQEYLDRALAQGQGVVLLTGHFGNWELSLIVAGIRGYAVTALARKQKLPRLYRLLISYREAKGCTIVSKGLAVRAMVKALQANGIVGIVGDQDTRQSPIWCGLFGRTVGFAPGPLHMAVTTGAAVIPAFAVRRHGPYHTIILEAPFQLDPHASVHARVEEGTQAFARLLERYVRQDPDQWLWLHKRWKSTPHRRALILSDGKTGHVKQSRAMAQALQQQCDERRLRLRVDEMTVQYRSRLRRAILTGLVAVAPRRCLRGYGILRWALTPESAAAIARAHADFVISTGAAAAPVNVLAAYENRAKALISMRPSLIPLSKFDLVAAPAHDRLPPRRNVVTLAGATTVINAATLQRACETLARRLGPSVNVTSVLNGRGRSLGLILGGDFNGARLTPTLAEAAIQSLLRACDTHNAQLLATTSRRTAPAVDAAVGRLLSAHARCPLLVRPNAQYVDGAMESILALAQVLVVSGDSISMVSEAVASGKPVVVVEPEWLNRGATRKHRMFLERLARQGRVRVVAPAAVDAALGPLLNAAQPSTLPNEDYHKLYTAMDFLF